MTNTEQLRKNMLDKIKELFQLDQPDLDFGFYRIMHSRAKEITDFIEHDLLDTIKAAFDSAKVESSKTEFDAAKAKVIDALGDDAFDANGTLNPAYANTKAGKEFLAAQQKLADSSTMLSGEDSVYYHLYKFFSRYYDDGDFISMRYHTRETDGMAKPYAVPYGGEEVMLHWANQDQYYVKTSENFKNFSFDLTKAKLFEPMNHGERILAGIPDHALTVHFKIVEAEEGEHGNIKADPNKKREFFLAPGNPVVLNPSGELEVHFEYRQAEDADAVTPEDEALVKELYGAKNKGDFALLAMTAKIIAACKSVPAAADFLTVMEYLCPTEAVKKRILLSKYLYQYTARNTSDYFIHKNLRGFLRREMDFYIKNEIMNLDDIENTSVTGVENYLILLKVFRKIAGKLIDFLGQLEDFQKKLWLKKKFVTRCDYCITLDRVPEKFYDEIFSNEAQLKEWQSLGFISALHHDYGNWEFSFAGINHQVADSRGKVIVKTHYEAVMINSLFDNTPCPVLVDIRKSFGALMVDTKFFGADFKIRLLSSIPDLDEQCDGLLIHSENFQALNLLQERYREQVKCIYIDPPYNTEQDRAQGKFIYKDNFEHSSWLSMIHERIYVAANISRKDCVSYTSLDDNEIINFAKLINNSFQFAKLFPRVTKKAGKSTDKIAINNDWLLAFSKTNDIDFFNFSHTDEGFKYTDEFVESRGKYKLNQTLDYGSIQYSASLDYEINIDGEIFIPGNVSQQERKERILKNPIRDFCWRWSQELFQFGLENGFIVVKKSDKTKRIYTKTYQGATISKGLKGYQIEYKDRTKNFSTLDLIENEYSNDNAKKDISVLFTQNPFEYSKPISLVSTLCKLTTVNRELLLDYFAGSGTTGHAVINLNREDGGKRKYILVEMGDHFDTVLKPRIEKVVFSPDWKDGKPTTFDNGVSHCFKYVTLESYEDTLNNLVMPETDMAKHMPPALKEDYMLHYMLDTEARESLLNVKDFANPFGGYQLNVKQPDSDASVATAVDLIETFNYLIGLRIQQYYRIQSYTAEFKRSADPELPNNGAGMQTRLEFAARPELEEDGKWRFQKIEGYIPANPLTPNDGQRKNVLIVWRTLSGDLERDNLILDYYMGDSINLNEKRAEYDIIYVNGSNTLGADRKESDSYQVRLIEEEFLKKMWSGEEI